jgi:hypothetical protein
MRGTDASLYRSVRLSLPPLVALARPRRHWRASLPDGPAFGEGAAPGWGKLSTPLPTLAWHRAGPVTPSPVRSYLAAVNEICQPRMNAPALSRSPAPCLCCATFWGHSGRNEGRRSTFPIGRCEGADPANGAASIRSSFLTPRWREPDSNHRSLSCDKYPNGLKKTPELSAHGQPRCVHTREMRGRSRYPDNPVVRRGPMSCPNALPRPCAPRVRLVGRTLCSIAL